MNDQILTFSETAQYLKIGEKTLQRAIARGEIPCAKVGNQWRFMRTVIDDWLISEMHFNSSNAVEKILLEPQIIQLSRLIHTVNTEISASSKREVLSQLMQPLSEINIIQKPISYLNQLLDRETIVSTAISRACAIPHVRQHELEEPNSQSFISVGICKEGVNFDSLDGKPTKLFFLLHAPNETMHLRILSHLTHLIKQDKTIEELIESATPESFIQNIIQHETTFSHKGAKK